MLSFEIRRRIAQLHRSQHGDAARDLQSARQVQSVSGGDGAKSVFQDPFKWAEECENSSGRHLRLSRSLATVWPAFAEWAGRDLQNSGPVAAGAMHAELAAVAESFPQGTLFLDLETCGFAGAPVFLAGLIWRADETLVLDQLFARHYAEERALLETLWKIAAGNRVLVTFNGKSFDWPMVHDRSTRHHLGQNRNHPSGVSAATPLTTLGRRDPRPQLVHCDVLHHARRRWKRVLPNCKLQTLERWVCNRSRRDDLAGAQVPAAYHEFVRTGEMRHIPAVLRHNALDLLTLVQITLKLLEPPIVEATSG
jgi:uncharacterized protein YprB with RNaseH-like and TPR domain